MDLNSGMICQVALISSVHLTFGFHVISKIADEINIFCFTNKKPVTLDWGVHAITTLVRGTFFWLNAYIPAASCSTSCCHKFEIPTKWMESSLASVTWVCLAGLRSEFNWRWATWRWTNIFYVWYASPIPHLKENAHIYIYIYLYVHKQIWRLPSPARFAVKLLPVPPTSESEGLSAKPTKLPHESPIFEEVSNLISIR